MNTSAKPFRVEWRRSEVNSTFIASLTKSDRAAWIQTGGHFILFALTGGGVILTAESQLWPAFAAALIAHGVVASFLTNGIHELSHGTVFESAGFNRFFLNVFGFIRWINPHAFWASHSRHHRYTLYPPYDREVVLPAQLSLIDFFRRALLDPLTMIERVCLHVEYACGIFRSDWDREILQQGSASSKVAHWSRGMLLAHGLAAAVLLPAGAWPAFVAISLTPAYGGFLFYLCNNTQHAGMKSQTPDFRESCRTIYLGPALEFLYWRMNFHAEHHMYPNVPCYRLRSLHDAVRDDLPPATRGLVEAWRAIAASAHPAASDSQWRHAHRNSRLAMPVIVFGEGMIELSTVRDGAARVAYGGDALNTAIYLARENVDVEFVSALGDDSFSRELHLAWAGEGLQLSRCLVCAGGKPGIYAISVDEQGERSFTYWRLESAARRFFDLPGAPAAIAFMKQAAPFYCSGITLSIFDDAGRGEILGIMDAVRANGGDVAFDINYRPKGWPAGAAAARDAINSALERASVCFSSAEDWTLLYGPVAPEAIAAVLRAKGCREAIVKDGPRGCFLSTAQTTQWIAPEAVVNPVDTTGAGDSFNAGYLAARRRGAAPPEACRAGNDLARKVILQPGAIAPR